MRLSSRALLWPQPGTLISQLRITDFLTNTATVSTEILDSGSTEEGVQGGEGI